MVEITDSKSPKTNAQRKPSIVIPDTNLSAKIIISTFIIKRKSPSVMIVRGSVNITSKGFTMALRTANTSANIIAVVKLLITTCGANTFESI